MKKGIIEILIIVGVAVFIAVVTFVYVSCEETTGTITDKWIIGDSCFFEINECFAARVNSMEYHNSEIGDGYVYLQCPWGCGK